MQDPMSAEELRRYATAIVRGALSVRRGDDLIVRASPGHHDLVVALAEAAYDAGARTVEPVIDDPRVTAARIVRGRDEAIGYMPPWQLARARAIRLERTAVIQIVGEFEADVIGALPPERVAEDTKRRLARSPDPAQSRTHIDVMIGTDDLEADGVTATGRRVTLLRDGLWQI
jgi:leucyl aminopeptidase (aminopeptidase T)